MPVVYLTGIPIEGTMSRQLQYLKKYLSKAGVFKFWVKEVADTRGTDLKEASVNVNLLDDAYTLESYTSQHPYRKAGEDYWLSAEITDFREVDNRRARSRSPAWINYGESGRDMRRNRAHEYERDYSYERNSPFHEDSSKLDLELELLRKKRLLIEEERKLLLEQKKLEYIKEFGVSASEDFERRGRSRDRRQRPERHERSPPRRTRPPPPRTRPPPPPLPPKRKGIPQFVLPCKLILKEMKEIIDAKTEQLDEKKTLEMVLRSDLRKKFAMALEGQQEYITSSAIIKLYREKYPVSGDEKLVTEALEGVRLSLWTSDQFPAKDTDTSAKKGVRKTVKNKNQGKSGPPKAASANVKKEPVKIEPKQEKVETAEKPNDVIVTVKKEEVSDVNSSVDGADETDAKQKEEPNVKECVKVETETIESVTEEKNTDVKDIEKGNGTEDTNAVELNAKDKETQEVVESNAPLAEIEPIDIDAVFDQLGDGGDDDWVENGVEWNDDEEDDKDEQ